MQQAVRFWDRIADRYAAKPIADEEAYEHKLSVTRRHLRPDMNMLELGCGTGGTAIRHAPCVRHVRAVDISPRMIEIAKGRAYDANVRNVSFEVAAVEDLDVADESVSVVLGMSLLHLLDDKEAAIARIHRMLKPGGVFVSSTACIGDGMRWLGLIAPMGRKLGIMPMVKIFTTGELVDAIEAGGFEIDYRWQPAPNKGVFIVARKPG